jgi:diguanylate cyclase (GGDEF)-like protein
MIYNMTEAMNSFLSRRSASQMVATSIAVALLIGLLDHITGYELSFSVFYVAPISAISWYVGRRPGVVFCLLSTAIWLIVDLSSGNMYSHAAIPFWNAAVRLGFFIVISLLLSTLHAHLRMERSMAKTDALTGLLNGRAFRETAQKVLDLCRRIGGPATLGYIDLDNFKAVNDALGHAEGDEVLKVVGSTLAQCVRSSDLVGRLGGDEFAVILPDTNHTQARTVMMKIRQKLTEEVRMHNWPVGFSIGVAVLCIPPPAVDEAITLADNLMYGAKRAGKNNIVYEEFGGAKQAG